MANQAIALQARTPQSNILGGAIQQNAQLMNMMAQQRSAERQAARTAQEMDIARAAEGRAVTAEERAARKAQQEYAVAEVTRMRNRGAAVGDEAGYQMWLSQVEKISPDDAALFRQYSPTFDPDKMKNIIMEADKFIDKNIPTPSASLQYGEGGEAFGVTVGGMGAPRAQEVIVTPPGGAQPRTPTSEPTAAPTFDGKIETAARAILKGAGIGDSAIRALTPEEFDIAAERANELKAAIRENRVQPISMTTGPQMAGEQPDLAAVVQDMMSSGQISQANLQLMRDAAGPANDAQLAQILKSNNIQIVPDAQPGMRSAVFRPGEDAAPQMQLAQAVNRPGTQFRGRDPLQSPSQAPGAAGAVAEAQREPIPQAGARAQAQREPIPLAGQRAAAERASPSEVAATERAKAQAEADVKFMERFPTDRDSTRQMIALINNMIGDTYVENGRLMVKKGGRQPAPGFEDVIGATWRPGFRFIPGTAAADFDAKQKQIEGGTFLEAFERLKGGGQITQPEGEKATRAISRMERSVSEPAYVEAARELEGIIRTALKRAEERYARLQGQKPAARGGTVDELVKRYGG